MTQSAVTTPLDQGFGSGSPTSRVVPESAIAATADDSGVFSDSSRGGSTQWTDQPEPSGSTWGSAVPPAHRTHCVEVTGLERWEGKITDIDGDTFTAELFPIEREGMPITADFDLDLLGSDAATVVPGDVFYLTVRTVREQGKRPTRTENLRLRRLGRITHEEVQSAYAKADAMMERLEQLFD